MWQDLDEALQTTPLEQFDIIFVSDIFDRWYLFGGDYEKTFNFMKDRLAKNKDSCVIGNYRHGYDISSRLEEAAKETGMIFTSHCTGAENYWTLRLDL